MSSADLPQNDVLGGPPAHRPHVDRLVGPRGVALVMIGIGIGGLVLATLDYRRQMAIMRERYSADGPFHVSIVLAVASMIGGLGVLGFLVVFLRQ